MTELEAYWMSVNKLNKYKEDLKFENCYIELISEKSECFEALWASVCQNNLVNYTFDRNFENEFAKQINTSFENIWGHVSSSCSYEAYQLNESFETELNSLQFDKSFIHFSNVKSDLKYKTNVVFENFYEKIDPASKIEEKHSKKSVNNKPKGF